MDRSEENSFYSINTKDQAKRALLIPHNRRIDGKRILLIQELKKIEAKRTLHRIRKKEV